MSEGKGMIDEVLIIVGSEEVEESSFERRQLILKIVKVVMSANPNRSELLVHI